MSDFNYKLLNTKTAFKSLEVAYKYYSVELEKLALMHDLELKKISRDSVIQRFEYTVELNWKLLFEFIKTKHLIEDLVPSPKSTLRAALKLKLLNEEETEKAIQMIDDRNLTSHTYKEEVANDLLSRIPDHIKLLKKIISEIEQRM